ncbi:Uncharacterised protein [Serratia fonticola]|uniref:Alginate lyase domain-containing protein n=1 Tax=Serratia fonticola TaxID=47917 RepID=A0A4U9UCH6_SERFO|nr:Uncharacterised protein [Serratia fonticola]
MHRLFPGINDGRGIGLIDSRALVDVIDAIELLRPANVISDKEYQQLKQWYGDFLPLDDDQPERL